MKYLIKGIMASSLLICSMGAFAEDAEPPASPFTFTGNINLTTDYAFRGLSQTDENPAVQGGFNASHSSGLYAGVWASNLDFNEDESTGKGATIEVDIFGGYTNKITDDLSYDVGLYGYVYPGADSDRNYDYAEVYAGLKYSYFSAKYWYSPDFFAASGSGHYIDLAFAYPLPNDFGFLAHVGRQYIEENDTFGAPDYTDFRIGVNKALAGFGFDLSYIDTDLDKDECFGGTTLCDGRVVFTVSKTL